ncbi:hypothetical protein V6615_05740 [Oscillospiraceae bacterium PP1C4]
MNKTTTTAVTGMAVAMVAGTAAYMLSNQGGKNNTSRKIKRSASKAIKTLGSVLDSVQYMMR